MARQRLELLMSDSNQPPNGSTWLALNDAAHCVQRALVALGAIGVRTTTSSPAPAVAARLVRGSCQVTAKDAGPIGGRK